ncbi:3'-5' DNA helicase [Staphylotrichum longicolle]|uniref:ATP-dependent DNA helicase n=1 Tax=Staphylotrichum longicolle TaxID=669026 RepID=A0AAD4I3K9_9PEZI|nr:3'-5' DNA helicase [Staphylotrichum longicolle]
MDDNEFDDEFDDIPDEDLIALTQATDAVAASLNRLPGRGTDSGSRTLHSKPSAPFVSSVAAPPPPSRRAAVLPASDSFNRTRAPGNTAHPSLDDLPSDAFDSSPQQPSRAPFRNSHTQRPSAQPQNLRQTTLWGGTIQESRATASQAPNSRPFRADLPPEAPTHHELDRAELSTWVYPLNLGPIRDYQFSIVKNGLFNNTLVALPTGLGKTFIAATVMLNYFRWTKSAKIVFVAPTKPLAAQQVQACLNIAGIPRSQATLLTGETAPVLREAEWASRRLFFMTPQTLMNDLAKGYADPKSIVLLVIDEAHRATGNYDYVKVVEFMRRFSKSFRVLALTATPGSTVEGVQDIIDNLGISHVEIRTEESIDIRQYVHSRNIDTITFDPSDEMCEVKDLFSKALQPLVDKLSSQKIIYSRDPMHLTTFGLLKSRQEWMNGQGRHVNQGVKFMIIAVFSILQSLAHAIKLLNFHGIKPFYNGLAEFRSTEEGKPGPGSKLKRQLLGDENFQKMMSMMERWMRKEDFNGHPKLAYLCETLVNHFIDRGEDSNTRAIVFSEYRDSAEEIVRLLNNQPLIRAAVFVGQADSKRSEGMKQKQQIETIAKFKSGGFNVLVATSIGEEGLDIGQVDLIVCYDASASPIRMLQRMGRTGRKRAGNIVLLLMKGREEEKFLQAKDNYLKMQQLICSGESFTFRNDLSTRIVPRDARPEVDKRHVDIPIENSQNPSLPEPKKTAAGLRKKPAKKKFNMPDGVETGFMKASFLGSPLAKLPKPQPLKNRLRLIFWSKYLTWRKPFADDDAGQPVQPGHKAGRPAPNKQRVADRSPAAKRTSSGKSSRKRKAEPTFLSDCEEVDDDDDEEEETADEESTPQQHRGRGRGGRGRGPAKRGRGGLKRVGDHLEDLGDDCTRTSDMEETDGSDSGADLDDFIVGDDVLTSSIGQRSTGPTTPGSSGLSIRSRAEGRVREDKPFYEPMEFGATQETDDEMPDLAGLVAKSTPAKRTPNAKTTYFEEEDDTDNEPPRPSPRRPVAKRRRQVLADSDDDE